MSTITPKEYQGGALQDALALDCASGAASATGTDASSFPTGSAYPYVIEFERGTTNAEKVLCTSRSGNVHTLQTRGYDGTSAKTHLAGSTIHHVIDAKTLTDLWLHITDTTRNDHTQYLSRVADKGATGNIVAIGTTAAGGSSGKWADAAHVHVIGSGAINASAMFGTAVVVTSAIVDANVTRAKLETNEQHPTGAITMFGGASAPAGWLLCNGTSYLRATYPNLFAVIGTGFGSADGTHFNVPDMRGRGPIGVGAGSGLTSRAINDQGGAETFQLTSTQLPAHTHTITAQPTSSVADHTHTYSGTTSSNGSHNHSIPRADPTGAGDVLATNARTVNTSNGSFNTSSDGAHTHTYSGTTAAGGGHSHTVTGTTDSAGSGTAFSLETPYIAVNFIIKY